MIHFKKLIIYNQYSPILHHTHFLISLLLNPPPLILLNSINIRKYHVSSTTTQQFEKFVQEECKSGNIRKLNDGLGYFNKLISMNPLPSTFTLGMLLGSIANIQCYLAVISLRSKMNLIGIKSNTYILTVLIHSCCKMDRVDYGFCILGEIIKKGFRPNCAIFSTLIKGLCVQKNMRCALKLFVKMTEKEKVEPNIVTCNTLIFGLCRVGEVGVGLELKRNLEKWNCEANVFTYNVIIDALCKEGSVDEALCVFAEMVNESSIVVPDVVVFNSLISGLCGSGRVSDARRLFDEMPRQGITANGVTYNSLLHGYCQYGQWEELREYLKEMVVDRGMSPYVVSFDALVDSLCKGGKVEEACELLELMVKLGRKPSRVACNTIINGLCLIGRLDEAAKLFDSMEEDYGLEHDVFSFDPLIGGYCKSSRLDEAVQVLKKMVHKGLKPTESTFKRLINKMQSYDESPGLVAYTEVLDGLCKNLHIDEAMKLFQTLERTGFEADIKIYNILIDGLCKTGKLEDARKLFSEIPNQESVPDVIMTYNIMINGFCENGMSFEAEKLIIEMEEKGCLPNSITYNSIIHGFLQSHQTDKAMQLLQKMLERKCEPNDAVITLLRRFLLVDELKKLELSKKP